MSPNNLSVFAERISLSGERYRPQAWSYFRVLEHLALDDAVTVVERTFRRQGTEPTALDVYEVLREGVVSVQRQWWPSYAEYLATAWWRQRRAQHLEAIGHRCQLCNATGALDVHHRTYERLGAEASADLLALCRTCHERFHQNARLQA